MMTGLMLWMSGNGVHIFSIMVTFYAIYNPIKSAFTVNGAFSRFGDAKMSSADRANLLSSKAMFVALNIVAMSGCTAPAPVGPRGAEPPHAARADFPVLALTAHPPTSSPPHPLCPAARCTRCL